MSKEAMELALEALESLVFNKPFDHRYGDVLADLREALAEQPASYKIRMDLPASISSEAIEADKLLKPQPAQQPTNCRHCGGADNVLCAGQCKVQPAQQEPVALNWQQSPIRTAWGDDMVVASVAIDNDHTLSLYCERDQTPKVNAMFAQRTWVGLTEDEVTLCHSLAVLSKKHDGTDPSFTTLLHQQIEAKLKEKNT